MSTTHSTAINFSAPSVNSAISASTPQSSAPSSASNSPPLPVNNNHNNRNGGSRKLYANASNQQHASSHSSGVSTNGSMQECDTEVDIPASVISSVGSVTYQPQPAANHHTFVVSSEPRPMTMSNNYESANQFQSQPQQSYTQTQQPSTNAPQPPPPPSDQQSPNDSNFKMVQPSAAPRLHPKKRKFDLAELDASPPNTPAAAPSTKSTTLLTPTATPSPTDHPQTTSSNGFLDHSHQLPAVELQQPQSNDFSKCVPPTKMVSLAKVLDDGYKQHQPELPKAIQARLQQMSSAHSAPSVASKQSRTNHLHNGYIMDEANNGHHEHTHMNDWSTGVPANKMVSLANVLEEGYQYPGEQTKRPMHYHPSNNNHAKKIPQLPTTSAGFVLTNLRPPPPTNQSSSQQHHSALHHQQVVPQPQHSQQNQLLLSNESSMDTLDLTQWANHRVLAKQGDYFVAGCIRTAITTNSVLIELNHPEGATQVYHDVLGSGRFDVISDASPSVSDVSCWICFEYSFYT